MPQPLFVYGTLRDPDVLALVLGHPYPETDAEPATAPGCRVVLFPGRTYPALLAAPGEAAPGTLLHHLSGTDLAALDLFEGAEYQRRSLDVIVSGGHLAADVYWPATEIGGNAPDWRFADWVGRHKSAFLSAEVRGIEELRRHLSNLPT